MTKPETIGTRPRAYSEFHRSFCSNAYAIDIDFVEWRSGRGIVALFGVTGNMNDEGHLVLSRPYIWKRTEMERKVLCEMASKLGVPAFYVFHTISLDIFHVYSLLNNECLDLYVRFNASEYRQFIEKL